jgi:hypothetical protein
MNERSWRRFVRGSLNIGLSAAIVAALAGNATSLFQASDAPEMTAMQRQILLLHDDCHRALDDPSSINRYSFKTYQQYVNYCVERRLRDTSRPYKKPRLA